MIVNSPQCSATVRKAASRSVADGGLCSIRRKSRSNSWSTYAARHMASPIAPTSLVRIVPAHGYTSPQR